VGAIDRQKCVSFEKMRLRYGAVECTDVGGGFCPYGQSRVCHDDCICNCSSGDANNNDAHCSGGGPRLTV
jgi:hypothetical protein